MPDEPVHEEILWITQVRKGPEYPWRDNGSHSADAGAVLRTYDFYIKNPSSDFPETRLVRTHVSSFVEDPELLRKLLDEKSAQEGSPDVQSS